MADPKLIHVALVMNGGVSLAVWMGGVTHEIDRLRRRGVEAAPQSPAWQAICRASGLAVTVDYVSGTSAGGLNGALLATAIAEGCPLPDLRGLWGEEGRLVRGKLLHRTRQEKQSSVLDGGFFQSAVTERLAALKDGADPQDVTLLVTASALYGSSTAVTDASRQAFKAGDHRRVYRFRRRANARKLGHEGQFEPNPLDEFALHSQELALAARSSAGFPFAFGPTQETPSLHKLNVTGSVGGPSWLVDGGVLDNAPFRPLLDELRDQPFQDPGSRWIVYVVPSKQAGSTHFRAGPGATPPHWTALPGRLWSLSRESDLRDDVIALADEWENARASVHPPEVLIGGKDAGAPEINLDRLAEGLWPAYRRTKMVSLETEFLQLAQTPLVSTDRDAGRLEDFLNLHLCWIPDDRSPTARTMGMTDDHWQWGPYTARRLARWISRDARGVTGLTILSEDKRSRIAEGEENLRVLHQRLKEIVRAVLDDKPAIVGNVMAAHLATVESQLLIQVNTEMLKLIETWSQGRGMEVADATARLLNVEIVYNSMVWQGRGTPPPFDLHLLSPDSPHQGTVLGLGDESDATLTPDWPDNKLYGTRLGHFGGFGAREFRDWDWMWGRIDAALTLGRALLHDTTLSDQEETALIDSLLEEILADHGIDPAKIQPATAKVVQLRPGQLVAQARNSNETNFNAVIDDLGALVANNPLLIKPVRGGIWSKAKGRMRGWAIRRIINLGKGEAKRLVSKQQP